MYNIVRQGQIIEEETKQLGLEPLEVDTQLMDASNDFHPAGDLQHIKKKKNTYLGHHKEQSLPVSNQSILGGWGPYFIHGHNITKVNK
jgi:hypothetical protein